MNVEEVERDTVFLQHAGSHIYGTKTPTSDDDYRGVCIPSDPAYYLGFGLKTFEQKDKGWSADEDKVVYDLRKAIKLMADGNPNMIDLLFAREDHHIVRRPAWERVLEHRDKFLSTKMRHTYGGYAFAQLKRLKNHHQWLRDPPKAPPTREEFGLPPQRLVKADELGAFEWLLARLIEDSKEGMRLSASTKEELSGVSAIAAVQSGIPDDALPFVQQVTGASDDWMSAVAAEKKFRQAKKRWQSYQQWQASRNKKRAELELVHGYDTKHAMHLVRLLRMGHEILTTGEVHVWRPDAEELLAIRAGSWTFEQLVDYADEMDQKLSEAAETSPLPRTADRKFLDELCVNVIHDTVFAR